MIPEEINPKDHDGSSSLASFDHKSGPLIERLIFNNRPIILLICLALTVFFCAQLFNLKLNANYERMIPVNHPFIQNFNKHKGDLSSSGNTLRIAVSNKGKSIFTSEYLAILRQLNDELYLLPGVDRAYVKSLWMPSVRWTAITEFGFDGGAVIPSNYNGSESSLEQVRINVERSGEVGRLVSNDYSSSIIQLPLLGINPKTKEALDYGAFSVALEELRSKYQAQGVDIHIIGFGKVVGDLIAGLQEVILFFVMSVIVAGFAVFLFTHCIRSSLIVVGCSLTAVIWQLGILSIMGLELDPYSILVPFLVFAIGMSHGTQKMNGIIIDIGRGTHKLIAARYTFRRLFMAGMTALISDTFGFAVLLMIDIGVIRELALNASIGVGILVITNLAVIPVLLSYTGVSPRAATRAVKDDVIDMQDQQHSKHKMWAFLDIFTQRKWAAGAITGACLLGIVGLYVAQDLKIGDLDPGAPELRGDSRYNLDNAFITNNFTVSSDIFTVLVETQSGFCGSFEALSKAEELEWRLRQLSGVDSVESMASKGKAALVGLNEGNLKWFELVPNQRVLNGIINYTPRDLFNQNCDLLVVNAYLQDHKAETLKRIVSTVEAFAVENNTENVRFILGAGNSGIEAATNIVVKHSNHIMLFWVYGVVSLLCLITFRSWRAVLVAVLPLMLTSILAEALMVILGMGVKVATLPVVALGVGIGIDYSLYLIVVLQARLKSGDSLSDAYYHTLLFTGKVVLLTGFTLSISVITWQMSDIKFQADMGVMLAFMFLWNMLGALILVPALSRFFLVRKNNVV